MGLLLLLLTSALLSRYVGRGVDAQSSFTIRSISLSLEPGENVSRDTNVTVRCAAVVSTAGHQPLIREYSIFKDSTMVYTKNTSSTEDLLYPLHQVRVTHAAKYKCVINIEGKEMSSEAQKLTVTGLSTPVLTVDRTTLDEGVELRASCTAPGETGPFIFYFYEDMKEKHEKRVKSDHVQVTFFLSGPGQHTIECSYTVIITPDSKSSEKSNSVQVTVKELSISPVLEITPQGKVYEGDQLSLSCAVNELYSRRDHQVFLYLSRGERLLQNGQSKLMHTMRVLAEDSADFECRLEMENVVKTAIEAVSVTELFSAPTLTMSPVEVFQKEPMTLVCKSETFASERLSEKDLTYTIDPPQMHLVNKSGGEFSGKALSLDFNYTCTAQAKGIRKQSKVLTVRPKVFVSTPKISVVNRPIIGRLFQIRCKSDNGSLPINYTLHQDYYPLSTVTVRTPSQEALFSVTVHHPKDINKFFCEAKNSHREGLLSLKLDATVVEPASQPSLTIIPPLPEVTEGGNLIFICSIRGTPPVTFKMYRHDSDLPMFTTTSAENNTSFEIRDLVKDNSGVYFFEAFNHANNIVRSDPVNIEVHLAMWKKVLIGGFCLLALSVLVVVCVLYFKAKRGKREAAAELSVKPTSAKSDGSLTENLTHDTEVNNAATVTRTVDRAMISVWTERPPNASEDEHSVVSNDPDVEYTEVVHPRSVDPARAPLRKGTDTVYSELQNSPHGEADHHAYGSVEYAELNGEQTVVDNYPPEVNHYHQDLPVPVD